MFGNDARMGGTVRRRPSEWTSLRKWLPTGEVEDMEERDFFTPLKTQTKGQCSSWAPGMPTG